MVTCVPVLTTCCHWNNYNLELSYFQFLNQSLAFFIVDLLPELYAELLLPSALSSHSTRELGLVDTWDCMIGIGWKLVIILTQSIRYCGYPTVCGSYGVCTNEQCSCPKSINGTSYFQQINNKLPSYGCSLVYSLALWSFQKSDSFRARKHHRLSL